MIRLQIYVTDACASCARSRDLAREIAREFTQVRVEIIEVAGLSPQAWPESLFATPTWLWNGRRYSLGTPDPRALRRDIILALAQSAF
jgi:hypothetical protein